MDDWFNRIAAGCELTPSTRHYLNDLGFVVIPGPVPSERLAKLAQAYDSAVACAGLDVLREGSTTTRVHDLVNRGSEFDDLYTYQPTLQACCTLIGRPFKLSGMIARTVRAHVQAQCLHVDFERGSDGWPMVGFIFMVDDFRHDNGATRFIPGSHEWLIDSEKLVNDHPANDERQVYACGPAGSLIIYNGSIWHGHGANQTDAPRRSIQGAFVRRDTESAFKWAAYMRHATLSRISPLAKYLLAVQ